MTPDLQDLLRQLDAIKAEAHAVCAGLSESQFNWRPGPKRWSIAECMVHLSVAGTRTLPAFDRAIEAGRGKGLTAEGPFRYGWFANWMVASMEPPPKRRMKTFGIFEVPAGASHSLARVLPGFITACDQLAERVRRSDGLDLRRIRVVSPVTRLLRMPLGAYLQFVTAHDRRHLWQAKQVRAASTFGQV